MNLQLRSAVVTLRKHNDHDTGRTPRNRSIRMKLAQTRIPLAIALSTALAFTVGCSDRTADDRAAMEPAGEPAVQTEPVPAPVEPMTSTDPAAGDSEQPGTDTWITAKVKSALLA